MNYPAPIAVAYRRLCHERSPTERIVKLFAVVESLVRYLVMLGVSDLAHCLAEADDPNGKLPDHAAFDFLRRRKSMQLAMWVEALRETAKVLRNCPDRLVAELPEIGKAGSTLLELLDELVEERGRYIHRKGSIHVSEEECSKTFPLLRAKLEQALRLVRFTRNYPLGFARQGLGQPSQPGQYRYYFHSCMGARIADTEQSYVAEMSVKLAEDYPFVVASDGAKLLYLWPLLLERTAKSTGRRTVFVFEEISDKRSPFLAKIDLSAIDAVERWTVQLTKSKVTSHAWLLERLRQLPAAPRLPATIQLAKELLPARRGQLVGEPLTPNLRLATAVATGGFGTIYAAKTSDGRQVAVKVLEAQAVRGVLRRFDQEFHKLESAGLHPGIVRCYERGIALLNGREYPWYSMELALGDLTCRIDERRGKTPEGGLPWSDLRLRHDIVKEFRAVAEAVSHLHQLEIVHRDIKPGNVLVMEDGGLRLSDFGLVKNLSPSSDESMAVLPSSTLGGIKGTRIYMAPEQERGETVGKSADIYSLGILLAELATGKQPKPDTYARRGSTLVQCDLVRNLPKKLGQFLIDCTDVDPANRPADAQAMLDRFSRLEEGV